MSEQQVIEATVNEAAAVEAEAEEAAETVEVAEAIEAEAAAPVAATEATPEAVLEAPAVPSHSAAPESAAESDAEIDGGDPNSTVVRMLSVGQQVKGTVKRITEFGAFVDIGVGRDGLVHISELSVNRVGKVFGRAAGRPRGDAVDQEAGSGSQPHQPDHDRARQAHHPRSAKGRGRRRHGDAYPARMVLSSTLALAAMRCCTCVRWAKGSSPSPKMW